LNYLAFLILGLVDLWRIYDLDEKYQTIESKKKTLKNTFNEICKISQECQQDGYAIEHIEKSASLDDISGNDAFIFYDRYAKLSADKILHAITSHGALKSKVIQEAFMACSLRGS
jgi:hypothetical protein